MSREIKFRVRDRSTKELLGYEYFNTCMNTGFFYTNLSELKEGEDEGDLICHSDFHDPPMIRPKKLNQLLREQFTESKDKLLKDIYEGDIIRFNIKMIGMMFIGEVKFIDSSWCAIVDNMNEDLPFGALSDFEILGNIHDNIDLLK